MRSNDGVVRRRRRRPYRLNGVLHPSVHIVNNLSPQPLYTERVAEINICKMLQFNINPTPCVLYPWHSTFTLRKPLNRHHTFHWLIMVWRQSAPQPLYSEQVFRFATILLLLIKLSCSGLGQLWMRNTPPPFYLWDSCEKRLINAKTVGSNWERTSLIFLRKLQHFGWRNDSERIP